MSSLFGMRKKLVMMKTITTTNEEKTRLNLKSRFFLKVWYNDVIRLAIGRRLWLQVYEGIDYR
jgi:hypothetical protein